jgi:hypothetical protein
MSWCSGSRTMEKSWGCSLVARSKVGRDGRRSDAVHRLRLIHRSEGEGEDIRRGTFATWRRQQHVGGLLVKDMVSGLGACHWKRSKTRWSRKSTISFPLVMEKQFWIL